MNKLLTTITILIWLANCHHAKAALAGTAFYVNFNGSYKTAFTACLQFNNHSNQINVFGLSEGDSIMVYHDKTLHDLDMQHWQAITIAGKRMALHGDYQISLADDERWSVIHGEGIDEYGEVFKFTGKQVPDCTIETNNQPTK